MKNHCRLLALVLPISCLYASVTPLQAQTIFAGDGSDEPGFVAPLPTEGPPPPPANISSGETTELNDNPGPQTAPQSRAEKKNPPTPPVMFVKLRSKYGMIDWASRPNDLNNLLKDMKGKINVNFASEVKALDEINTDPDKNPIVYRSGHFHFSFTPAERKRLREYLLNGGTIIFNTGMGSKPFFDSAKAELAEIFPEIKLQRLTPDHPLFHSYYDIGQVNYRKGVRAAGYTANDPLFYGITIDCRTVAVLSRWCMAIGWDELDDDALQGYSAEDARKLGINILAYATSQRAWAKTVAHAMNFVDPDSVKAGKVFVAQIIYDGEWKTRHAGISVLLQQFNRRTDIPVKFGRQELRFSDPKIFDAPILYITGHDDFQIGDAEAQNLREYLNKGGCLMAEACCGRHAFNIAFVREMKKVFPDRSFSPLPADSPLFALPNQIKVLGVTPGLSSQLGGKTTIAPNVLGMEVNGHLAVIYSPYGMCGGWEMAQNPYALGYDDAGALSLGENILMHVMTH
ncbi:MAG: DUF4159 domain-containing protein [Kiritimatiellia bacterium]|jgi:hypothetical protein